MAEQDNPYSPPASELAPRLACDSLRRVASGPFWVQF
jgi:hypothetical protein